MRDSQKVDLRPYRRIAATEENLKYRKQDYLRKRGWSPRCDVPGALWVWTRTWRGMLLMGPLDFAFVLQGHIDSGVYADEPQVAAAVKEAARV